MFLYKLLNILVFLIKNAFMSLDSLSSYKSGRNTKSGENFDILNMFSWLVLLIILAPFLVYGLPQIVGAKDALIVKSGSMEPTIPTGSVITIYPVEASEVKKGDIITFEIKRPGHEETEYTTHRVIEVLSNNGEYGFRTKGDANEAPDMGAVTRDNLVGKYGFTIPYLGYVMAQLDTKIALVALVIVPATIIIISELWSLIKETSVLKEAGDTISLVETATIGIALIILAASAVAAAGITPNAVQDTANFLSFSPMTFGLGVMASILASMLVLKVI